MRKVGQMLGLLLMPITWLNSWRRRRREQEIQAIADAKADARLHIAYWGD